MGQPKVSIILPTYQGAKYISDSIRSVLAQSYTDWELLILIDGSTDESREIVRKYQEKDDRIVLVENEKNLRLARTLNKGVGLARGQYLARIDDDDTWSDSEKLKKQVQFLEKNPDYGLIGSRFKIYNETNKKETALKIPLDDNNIRKNILSFNPFCHSSVVFRKSILKEVGLYDEKLDYTEDWDLWLRIGSVSKMKNLEEITVHYLMRTGMSKNNSKPRQIRNHLRLLGKYGSKYPNKIMAVLKLINYAIFY